MRHEIDLFTSSKPKTDERNMNGEREVKETNVFFPYLVIYLSF